MRDQVQKLEGVLNVCVLQSVGEEEGEGKVTIPEDIKKCCLMFGHPEVFDSWTRRMLPKMLTGKAKGCKPLLWTRLIWFLNGIYIIYLFF